MVDQLMPGLPEWPNGSRAEPATIIPMRPKERASDEAWTTLVDDHTAEKAPIVPTTIQAWMGIRSSPVSRCTARRDTPASQREAQSGQGGSAAGRTH